MKSNKFWVAVSKMSAAAIVMLILTLISAAGAGAQIKYKTLHIFRGKGRGGSLGHADLRRSGKPLRHHIQRRQLHQRL
jgi:hypothetical protein